MPKKNFKTNVTEDFFTQPEKKAQEDAAIEYRSAEELQKQLPPGFKIVKENKTRRMQFLVRPTTYEGLKKQADKQGISINELVNSIFEDYIERTEK